MANKLVIVESPTKTKAIEKYLGENYKVVSSKGHIRDLATSGKFGLGVDIENHFEPNYIAIKGKKKDIDSLKKDAKNANKVTHKASNEQSKKKKGHRKGQNTVASTNKKAQNKKGATKKKRQSTK